MLRMSLRGMGEETIQHHHGSNAVNGIVMGAEYNLSCDKIAMIFNRRRGDEKQKLIFVDERV